MAEPTAGSLGLCGPEALDRARAQRGLPPHDRGVTRAEPDLDDDDDPAAYPPGTGPARPGDTPREQMAAMGYDDPPSLPETAKRARDGSPFIFDPDSLPTDDGSSPSTTAHQLRDAEGDDHPGPCSHPPKEDGTGRVIRVDGDLYVPPQLFAVERDWETAGSTSGRIAWGYRWPDGVVCSRPIGQGSVPFVHDSLDTALEFYRGEGGPLHATFH